MRYEWIASRPRSRQTLIRVEAFVSNACRFWLVAFERIAHGHFAEPSLLKRDCPGARDHYFTYDAHRQIHAKDAGGAAGGTGPRFAG